MRRRLPLALGLLAGGAGILLASLTAWAEPRLHGSDDENYWLTIPPDWVWERPEEYSKHGAVEVAQKEFTVAGNGAIATPAGTLAGPYPPGVGGRVMLCRQDVPKQIDPDYETWVLEYQVLDEQLRQAQGQGQTTDELRERVQKAFRKCTDAMQAVAQDEIVTGLMRSRFTGTPKVEVSEATFSSLPAARITAEGTAFDLEGKEAPCEAQTIVYVIRQRMWRLCIWLWHGPRIKLLLRNDLDAIELDFKVPKPNALPRRVEDPPKATPAKDEGQDKSVPNLSRGLVTLQPKGWVVADDGVTKDPAVTWRIRRSGLNGSESVFSIYSYSTDTSSFELDRYVEGVFSDFLRDHPSGPLQTFEFPRVGAKTPYLSQPEYGKPSEVKRPALDRTGRAEPVARRMLEQEGVLSEVRTDVALGNAAKESVTGTWRMSLRGEGERGAPETSILWFFRTKEWTHVVHVVYRKDALTSLAGDVARMLASLDFLKKPR